MNVRLTLERNRKRIWTAQLCRPESTVGRASGCTVRIPSSEVSRLHCRLRIENDLLFVEDLESVNGTFVNGERVEGSEIVRPGDRLSLGSITFLVEYKLTPEALRRLGGGEGFAVLEDEEETADAEDVSAQPTTDWEAAEEPAAKQEEADEELFHLDEQEELHLPEGGDLRDFLIELDDTDETSKKPKK